MDGVYGPGTSIYPAPWARPIARSQWIEQASGQRVLAIAGAQLCEYIFVAEADVDDGVVTGVVDDEGAVCSTEHPTGEHHMRDVHVRILGCAAVGGGREEHRDARH